MSSAHRLLPPQHSLCCRLVIRQELDVATTCGRPFVPLVITSSAGCNDSLLSGAGQVLHKTHRDTTATPV